MGNFLGVDEGSVNFLHTTYAQILVEMDLSKDLPVEAILKAPSGDWKQNLDYEGVPFRCGKCFNTSHVVDQCSKHKRESQATWWKEVSPQYYSVEQGNLGGKEVAEDQSGTATSKKPSQSHVKAGEMSNVHSPK